MRGSSSRLGASALIQLSHVFGNGRDVVITPDGPRGPAYRARTGDCFSRPKIRRRRDSGEYGVFRCWRVKSWDRFFIPRPFSKVRVIIGAPHEVRSTTTPEEFEAERLRLQEAMMALVEMR